MGGDEKMPVISERSYKFEGYYDMRATYDYLKNYIENSMFYHDVTEEEYEEKSMDGLRSIVTHIAAEKIYNDYFKIIIKFKVDMSGNDTEVKTKNKTLSLTKGKAELVLNAYIIPDWQSGGREKTHFRKFLGKIYDKFVGTDELNKCIITAAGDVGVMINRFGEYMNSTIKWK